MDGESTLSDFLKESELCDDLFSILEALESGSDCNSYPVTPREEQYSGDNSFQFRKPAAASFLESEADPEEVAAAASRKSGKRRKVMCGATSSSSSQKLDEEAEDGPHTRMTHIAVERNRRKQMNDHLSVLRSLMPCFYVKRGDQASIIGGVVNYITELQQLLQTLHAKKQRKAYADVMSPRPVSSTRPPPNPSPKPPLSPRTSVPVSPTTPLPNSPYKPLLHYHQQTNLPSLVSSLSAEPSPCNSSSNINDAVNELVASSKTAVAEVEVKFSGPNLLLRTVSNRIPGQAVKIISALEQQLQLEILRVKIGTVDDTMLYCFTIKIGIECQLSAEELAQRIQMTFCC